MKDCKSTGKNAGNSDYICNPETGIWVKKDGPTGKKILGSGQLPGKQPGKSPVKPVIGKKECKSTAKNATDPAYICNPQSGVCVKKDGPTGKVPKKRNRKSGWFACFGWIYMGAFVRRWLANLNQENESGTGPGYGPVG